MSLKKNNHPTDSNSLVSIVNKHMVIIFLITFLFVAFAVFMVTYPFSDSDSLENELSTVNETINDTISPEGINQAVSIEIKRVHKRNIEDQMRKIGFAWKQKPLFYVKAILDDVSWESMDVTEWDTGFAGWQANRFVEDEKEKIEITFQIIEKESSLFREKETVIEEFQVIYDFRTGRWNGDDSFRDNDGYGHYVGSDFELWFEIYQTEQDRDDIPYWTEINVLRSNHTIDDSLLDPDNDGIPTSWEWKWGYDPFSYDNHSRLDPDNDGLNNIEEYNLAKWLANPYHKDIYLEVDFMEKGPGLFADEHIFFKESQWILMDVFTPHNITVHIDDGWPTGSNIGGGEYLPYTDEDISPISGVFSGFYKYHFADCRKGSFRYVIIHPSGGWCFTQTNDLTCDVLSISDNTMFYTAVFSPPAVTPRLQRLAMAVEVLHELGHSLGLIPSYHAGIDNASQAGRNNLPILQKMQARRAAKEYWDTYQSVMNYDKFGQYVLDYSDGSHGKRDSDDWEYIDLTFFQTPFDEKYGIGND